MKNLKAFSAYASITYLQIVMKSFQLVKDLFVIDVAHGDEVVIPLVLKQSNLPLSYSFYNPVIKIIHENVSRNRRDYYVLK